MYSKTSTRRQVQNHTQRSSKAVPQNLTMGGGMQTPLAAIIQRARVDPGLLTAGDLMRLQHMIGNQAIGQLLAEINPNPASNNNPLPQSIHTALNPRTKSTGDPPNVQSPSMTISVAKYTTPQNIMTLQDQTTVIQCMFTKFLRERQIRSKIEALKWAAGKLKEDYDENDDEIQQMIDEWNSNCPKTEKITGPELDEAFYDEVWTPGKFNSSSANVQAHFNDHGASLNCNNEIEMVVLAIEFKRKAPDAFSQAGQGNKVIYLDYPKKLLLVYDETLGKIASFYMLSDASAQQHGYRSVINQLSVLSGNSEQVVTIRLREGLSLA